MVQDIVLGKFLYDLLPIAVGPFDEGKAVEGFANSAKEIFGIDKVEIRRLHGNGLNRESLDGYVINTKKAYIDNQLSEYSEFPKLIDRKHEGYSSCAIMPLIINGKAIGIIEFLSKIENRFSDEIVNSISIGAAFIGLAVGYAGEAALNKNLAKYFDSAFGTPEPHMMVNSNGIIVKANKSAIAALSLSLGSENSVENVLGCSFKELDALQDGKPIRRMLTINNEHRVFDIYSSKASQNTVYLFMDEVTERELFQGISASITSVKRVAILNLDKDFKVMGGFGNIDPMHQDFIDGIKGVKITDTLPQQESEKFLSSLNMGKNIVSKVDFSISGIKTSAYMSISKTGIGYVCIMLSAELEESVKRLANNLVDFVNATSDIVLLVDNSGIIIDTNMPAEQFLNYKKEELLGKDIRLLYSEQDILDRDIAYVKNRGKVDGSYVNMIKRNGEFLPATHSVRAFYTGSDYVYAIMIKELQTKRALDEMDTLIKKQDSQIKNFKMASELKSQFIYNISHELKTPLTNIKGFGKLLYDGEFGAVNGEQKEYIKTILDEADRLMLIITQVLDAAKLEANKVKLDLKEVNLSELYNNPSIKALEESAKTKGLSFAWNVNYDVPAITADPNRLIQVFVNLIGNSIKFTENGSITVHISKASKRSVMCEVIDTGIGISDEDKRKIFKKFYQASKKGLVKQDGSGTGLGLAITKEIIDLHRGKIKFDSHIGTGSRFWFTLPISQTQKQKSRN